MTADKGTFAYMAPEVKKEQNKKKLEYDHKADIFSLGLVFTQLLFHLNFKDYSELVLGHDNFDTIKH
jgi:serine/threonine protein kinase